MKLLKEDKGEIIVWLLIIFILCFCIFKYIQMTKVSLNDLTYHSSNSDYNDTYQPQIQTENFNEENYNNNDSQDEIEYDTNVTISQETINNVLNYYNNNNNTEDNSNKFSDNNTPTNTSNPDKTSTIDNKPSPPTPIYPTPSNVSSGKSDARLLYYNQLNYDEKQIYNTIEKACKNFNGDIELNNADREKVMVATYALTLDHPEYYWTSQYQFKIVNNDYVVEIIYDIPLNAKEMMQKIDRNVDSILTKMKSQNITSDYDKLKFFYEWIINNTKYGSTYDSQEITSVLVNHTSVCAGYSKAFLYLCQKSNIECAYVSGYTKQNESHGWNIVRVGQHYYWVDATWGDPVFAGEADDEINYNYFLVDDEELMKNHRIDYSIRFASDYPTTRKFNYPSCTDKSLNYYRRNGSYFDRYDMMRIRDYFKEKFRNNIYSDIEIKFANKSDYDSFLYNYLTQEDPYIYDDINAIKTNFYGTIRVYYTTVESSYYVKISVEFI